MRSIDSSSNRTWMIYFIYLIFSDFIRVYLTKKKSCLNLSIQHDVFTYYTCVNTYSYVYNIYSEMITRI